MDLTKEQISLLKSNGLLDQFLKENEIEEVSEQEIFDHFLRKNPFRKYSARTQEGYESVLRIFKREMNITNWQNVQTKVVYDYKLRLDNNTKLGADAKKRTMTVIRTFFDFFRKVGDSIGIKFHHYPQIPACSFEDSGEVRSNKDLFLNKEESVIFLRQLKLFSFKHYLIARLMLGSGLRIGDVTNIEIRNLDLQNRKVKTKTKTGWKTYFFNENTSKELAFYLVQRDKITEEFPKGTPKKKQIDHLLLNHANMKIKTHSYTRQFSRLVKKAGCQKSVVVGDKERFISCHTCRRSFSTIRKNMGQIRDEISFLLGHTIQNITDLYIKMTYEQQLAIFDSHDFLSSL